MVWWVWQSTVINASMRWWGVCRPEASADDSAPAPAASENHDTYRFIAENGRQILCLVDAEKGCLSLSDNFERLTGRAPDSALGEQFYALFTPDSRTEARARLSQPARDEAPLTVQLLHADGTPHWYELSLCPDAIEAPSGQIACLLHSVQDHVVTHDSLRQAREALEIALRARSEFLAGMSHDLRTPLNAIIGFSEMMQTELFGAVESSHHRDYLRHIQDSGYELLSKIEDLLTLSRIEHADHRLHVETVDLAEPLHKAVAGNTYLAFSSRVTLDCRIAPGECILRVDRVRLQHGLSSLLAAAIRASLPESVVTLSQVIEEYGALRFSIVCDVADAAGLAAQAVTARQPKNNDPLRLNIARDIAQMHGGSISVRAGDGCVEFVLRLPARAVVQRNAAKILEFASGT